MAVLISISGASASGKTTVARELLASLPQSRMLLSVTTRTPRPSDVHGEYRYVSTREFEDFEKRSLFLWTVDAHHNRYGTLTESVREACNGGTAIAILTIPAAEKLFSFLSTQAPHVIFTPLYLKTHDEALLEKRLRDRGDSSEDVRIRMEECRNWNLLAEHSPVPFSVVDASLPLPSMLQEAISYIKKESTPLSPE